VKEHNLWWRKKVLRLVIEVRIRPRNGESPTNMKWKGLVGANLGGEQERYMDGTVHYQL